MAGEIRAHSSVGIDPDEQVAGWLDRVGSGIEGYVTPKITVGAVVGDEQGRLLLVKRADSGVWLFP
ncbi:MAG: hydrolase, partial [Acidimicrobiales bacterium]